MHIVEASVDCLTQVSETEPSLIWPLPQLSDIERDDVQSYGLRGRCSDLEIIIFPLSHLLKPVSWLYSSEKLGHSSLFS